MSRNTENSVTTTWSTSEKVGSWTRTTTFREGGIRQADNTVHMNTKALRHLADIGFMVILLYLMQSTIGAFRAAHSGEIIDHFSLSYMSEIGGYFVQSVQDFGSFLHSLARLHDFLFYGASHGINLASIANYWNYYFATLQNGTGSFIADALIMIIGVSSGLMYSFNTLVYALLTILGGKSLSTGVTVPVSPIKPINPLL